MSTMTTKDGTQIYSRRSWQERERAGNDSHQGPAEGPRFRGVPRTLPLPERDMGGGRYPPTGSRQGSGGKGEPMA